eukprot:TRINITY_DN44282_c0_g1_i1.p1 TRINITY_DN44282_c0_g1~~TRINITY_DN44282_c0_g1_i1.p1  ORF type:complete len:383 (-),score=64.90 TRINITY_DN44282_c0_g1_i1:37-1185(-)
MAAPLAIPGLSRALAAGRRRVNRGLRGPSRRACAHAASASAHCSPKVTYFSQGHMPARELEELYSIDEAAVDRLERRPYVYSMSVSTLDGRVAFQEAGSAGSKEVAMAHHRHPHAGDDDEALLGSPALGAAADWRTLAYSWSQADAVLGSGEILRSEPDVVWAADDEDLRAERERAGLPPIPLAVVATRKGALPVDHPIIRRRDVPCIVYTSAAGEDNLRAAVESAGIADLETVCNTKVCRTPTASKTGAAADHPGCSGDDLAFWEAVMLDLRRSRAVRLLNVAAGGQIVGALLGARLLDECRVNVAMQLAGDFAAVSGSSHGGLDGRLRPGLCVPPPGGIESQGGGADHFSHGNNPRLRLLGLGIFGPYHLFTRSSVEYRH